MYKKTLLCGVAAGSLMLMSAGIAEARSYTDVDVYWDNNVDVEVEYVIDVDSYLNIHGDTFVSGTVTNDALAQANIDNKQILEDMEVDFEDYQNLNGNQGLNTDEPTDFQSAEAHDAVYTNTVSIGGSVGGSASGNIGINMAAGDFNLQENVAVLANATSLSGQGGAYAATLSVQRQDNADFNDNDYEVENTDIDNTITVGADALSDASGNIGLNAAAGAFNMQKNAMAIASMDGANLANAAAAVMQWAKDSDSHIEDVTNIVDAGGSLLQNASGNIGVNLASGVGNIQHNSLTIAAGLAGVVVPPPITTQATGGGGSNI